MLHLGDALETLWNLVEATLAAVQLEGGDFPGFVEEFPTYGPAGVVGDVAAAVLCLLVPLQTGEELGLVAWPTGFVEMPPGPR